MDIGTGLALLGSAEILKKILGPTADYLGEGLKAFAEKRSKNISMIFSRAMKKIESENPESLRSPASPQLLATILDYGSCTEDELIHEYLSGLLVSSRKGSESDNRALCSDICLRISACTMSVHIIFSIR